MSADEIRRLAVDFSPKKGVYCEDLKLNELVYSAILAYAAMVERCEEKRKELDDEWFFDGADNLALPMEECYAMLDYILKGATDEET